MGVAVIGDVMLDKNTYYTTKRENPENKMIPLVSKETEQHEYRLGGAGNLAANIQAMIGEVFLYAPYHADTSEKILTACAEQGISLNAMNTDTPAIIKERIYIDNRYMYRIDDEKPIVIDTEQKQQIATMLREGQPSHIIISDYLKGTIDAELMRIVKSSADELSIPILVDTKPKHIDLFKGAYLIKPNFKEFSEMIGKNIENNDDDIAREGMLFVEKYRTNLVVTRSAQGATLITLQGDVFHLPTEVRRGELVDVTGAGDTFLAGIVTGLVRGLPLQKAVELGNKASGIAVRQTGTTVVTSGQLDQ